MRRTSATGAVGAAVVALLVAAGCGAGGPEPGASGGEPCRDTLISKGEKAPELELLGPGGEEQVTLQSLADGKVALVDVWATWCAPCIEAMPHLEAMQEQYADDGFTVIGVMSDGNASSMGPEWVAEEDLNYPMLYDDNSERLMCRWGQFGGYPTLFLLDREGVVVDVFMGTVGIKKIEERVAEVVEQQSTTASGGDDQKAVAS